MCYTFIIELFTIGNDFSQVSILLLSVSFGITGKAIVSSFSVTFSSTISTTISTDFLIIKLTSGLFCLVLSESLAYICCQMHLIQECSLKILSIPKREQRFFTWYTIPWVQTLNPSRSSHQKFQCTSAMQDF